MKINIKSIFSCCFSSSKEETHKSSPSLRSSVDTLDSVASKPSVITRIAEWLRDKFLGKKSSVKESDPETIQNQKDLEEQIGSITEDNFDARGIPDEATQTLLDSWQQKYAILGDPVDENGDKLPKKTLLHVICKANNGFTPLLLFLVEKKYARLSDLDEEGKTALDYCLEHENQDATLDLLIAMINEINDQDFTDASGETLDPKKEKLISLWNELFPHEDITPLHITCLSRASVRLIKYLLIQGVDINKQDNEGKTALHYSVLAQDNRAIQTLLGSDDIDPNIQDEKEQTPLHYAIIGNYYEGISKLLAAKGIDLSIKNNDGHTAGELPQAKQFSDLFKP